MKAKESTNMFPWEPLMGLLKSISLILEIPIAIAVDTLEAPVKILNGETIGDTTVKVTRKLKDSL